MKKNVQAVAVIAAIAGVYFACNKNESIKADEESGYFREDIQRDAQSIFAKIAKRQEAGMGMTEAEAKSVFAASKAGRDTSALIQGATDRRLKEPRTLGDSYLFLCDRPDRPCAEGLRNAVASVYLVLALQHGQSYGEAWTWATDLTDEYLVKHYADRKKVAEDLEKAGIEMPISGGTP